MSAVFELVDRTDEETYYPLGVFLSLEDAIKSVDSNERPWELSDQSDYCDFCALEIRERGIGFSGCGKVVWTRKWNYNFADEDDESRWVELK